MSCETERVELVQPSQQAAGGQVARARGGGIPRCSFAGKVFENRDKQLAAQGFQRAGLERGEGEVSATCVRGNDTLRLWVEPRAGGTYRARFDLLGVQGD